MKTFWGGEGGCYQIAKKKYINTRSINTTQVYHTWLYIIWEDGNLGF